MPNGREAVRSQESGSRWEAASGVMAVKVDVDNNLAGTSAQESVLRSYRALIKRLPITVRPALNGQLASWDTLFPFERRRFQEFMRGISALDEKAFEELIDPLRRIEARMGVEHWKFSQNADTMENASQLARSAEYTEWRNQVQRFYSTVQKAAATSEIETRQRRIILTVLPGSLPFERDTVWKRWGEGGIHLSIDGDPARITGLVHSLISTGGNPLSLGTNLGPADFWLIDAGRGPGVDHENAMRLNCEALKPLRDRVLEQVNTVPRNIEVTDQTLNAIRARNWDQWWPPEMSGDAALRKFVIDVYLSGNGALIFSNAFVQWAASEGIRRARPRILFARFGMRAKPKPFTGIAIFENQQHVSVLPDVDDPSGSAIDANMLARYILLSSQRYPEGEHTAFICVAESARSAYLVLPDLLRSSWGDRKQATPGQIAQLFTNYLNTPFS